MVRVSHGGIFDSVDWDNLKDGDVLPDDGVVVEGSEHTYVRYENILDEILAKFQEHYSDQTITKEAIFFYNYGLLHHKGYRKKYKSDLSKGLPRLPFTPDFWAFAQAGEQLGMLHVGYEQLPGHKLALAKGKQFDENDYHSWAFTEKKQQLKQQQDGTWTLKVNDHYALTGIPDQAQQYKVNGKTALGWLADRYRVHVDKKHNSGIVNDANALFGDDPSQYVKLVEQIVQMSCETVAIVDGLPDQFE